MQHYIYVIADGDGLHKIGVSRTPGLRLQQLRAQLRTDLRLVYVKEVERDAFRVENAIHKKLSDRKHHNEWFSVSLPEAKRVIVSIVTRQSYGENDLLCLARCAVLV